MNRVRKAPPSFVRYIYHAIGNCKNEQLTLEELVKYIKVDANVSDVEATVIVNECISDKILIKVVAEKGRALQQSKLAKGRPLSLPKPIEIPTSQHDHYCFECHMPGKLEFCTKCPRAFHQECYRKDVERPNYTVPSAKVQKNPIPEFNSLDEGSDEEHSDSEPETKSSTPQHAVSAADTTADEESPISSHLDEGKGHFDLNVDTKSKVDVMCLGEIRPPTRIRRSNVISSYAKNEVLTFEDDVDDCMLCTCCRLSKCAALKNPPNLEPDELCYLLNFTYTRNKSWIPNEIINHLDLIYDDKKSDLSVLRKVMLQIPIAPKNISYRIKHNTYTYLMEFLIDILDLQHNIGILYGDSAELDATKWLVRDVNHDLAEIGRCPDCYRYSNEKSSKGWFCKPCVQRHELVYAKLPGFPFWPAKVIRVLPNHKYDVRFFGGTHSRALVEAKYIRSIDTEPKQLKLSKSQALRSSIEELKQHQQLLHYPPSQFSYRANPHQVKSILDSVVYGSRMKRTRRSEVDNADQSLNATQSSSRKRRRFENSPDQSTICQTRSKADLFSSSDVQRIQNDLDDALTIIRENKTKRTELYAEIKTYKETIAKMEDNLALVKRKQWCFWCLHEAILLCCFKASYCSQECQKAHWDDGHSKVCKNRDLH